MRRQFIMRRVSPKAWPVARTLQTKGEQEISAALKTEGTELLAGSERVKASTPQGSGTVFQELAPR